MAEAVNQRAPESEIYGRSLSTIHRLGAFMIGTPLAEIPDSPEAAQARVEFYTSVEEGFGTDKELGGGLEVRDFDARQIINGKVMAKDLKTAVSDMTEAGLRCAVEKYTVERAHGDHRFLPQLTRSEHDHANALAVDQMARGETNYNTRIIVSPFPEEAAATSGDAYWRNIGYVPHLRRGFVQLYYRAANGELISGSLSFDGSNKQRLHEVFARLGVDVPRGEITDNWLKYAITDDLSEERAKAFAGMIADQLADPTLKKTVNTVQVTRKYKDIMDRSFDESYIHVCESQFRGYQTDKLAQLVHQFAGNAHHFNSRYSSALYRMRANRNSFTDDDAVVLHELLVYSTIEMMRALHLGQTDAKSFTAQANNGTYLTQIDAMAFQNMLGDFGAEGARNNRVYSACGIEMNLGGDNPDLNPQSTFGGNDNEGSSTKKTMSCPFCTAKVYDDPCARILKCWDCKAAVVDGRVVYKGDGGSKARATAREADRKAHEAEMAQQVAEVFAEANIPKTELAAQPGAKAGQFALAGASV
ncbi:MAG: hypothetical protein ACREGB_04980 [Candidatus Saccharimonadales bacterium]